MKCVSCIGQGGAEGLVPDSLLYTLESWRAICFKMNLQLDEVRSTASQDFRNEAEKSVCVCVCVCVGGSGDEGGPL